MRSTFLLIIFHPTSPSLSCTHSSVYHFVEKVDVSHLLFAYSAPVHRNPYYRKKIMIRFNWKGGGHSLNQKIHFPLKSSDALYLQHLIFFSGQTFIFLTTSSPWIMKLFCIFTINFCIFQIHLFIHSFAKKLETPFPSPSTSQNTRTFRFKKQFSNQ